MQYHEVRDEVIEAIDRERALDGGHEAYDLADIIDEAYVYRRSTCEYRQRGSNITFWAVVDRHKREE